MKKGYVQIYTGNGKGKTTAAMGLALRAAGRGLRVMIVQFLKGSDSGEIMALKHMPGIQIAKVSETKKFFWNMTDLEKKQMRALAQQAITDAEILFGRNQTDVLILDEAMGALKNGIINIDELNHLLNYKPEHVEIVLTGRDAPQVLIDKADLVTEMVAVKHYLETGVKARKGIEY